MWGMQNFLTRYSCSIHSYARTRNTVDPDGQKAVSFGFLPTPILQRSYLFYIQRYQTILKFNHKSLGQRSLWVIVFLQITTEYILTSRLLIDMQTFQDETQLSQPEHLPKTIIYLSIFDFDPPKEANLLSFPILPDESEWIFRAMKISPPRERVALLESATKCVYFHLKM